MTVLAINGAPAVRVASFPPQQTLGPEERAAVLEVLDAGVLSAFIAEEVEGGPKVVAAERAFAEYTGASEAVTVNSATTGLQVALAAVGIEAGDEVIVSPYTMSASAAAILLQNGVPVFADVEDSTFGLDPRSVEERITPRTRALLVVHLFGHPARMGELLALADRYGLAVIEDAAQSIGARWGDRHTGTLGTAGVLSLNYHKIIHSGEGGVVLTDDRPVAVRARLVRNHGEVSSSALDVDPVNTLGSNFRMTEMEAAIAREQLKKVEALLALRRALAERLSRRLRELPGIIAPEIATGCTHSWYVYCPRLDLEALEGIERRQIAEALRAEGIPVQEGYVSPVYLQPIYQRRIARGARGCPWTCGHWSGETSYAAGICPVTERLHGRELLALDVTREPLTPRDVDDVADAFEKVLGAVDELRERS